MGSSPERLRPALTACPIGLFDVLTCPGDPGWDYQRPLPNRAVAVVEDVVDADPPR